MKNANKILASIIIAAVAFFALSADNAQAWPPVPDVKGEELDVLPSTTVDKEPIGNIYRFKFDPKITNANGVPRWCALYIDVTWSANGTIASQKRRFMAEFREQARDVFPVFGVRLTDPELARVIDIMASNAEARALQDK